MLEAEVKVEFIQNFTSPKLGNVYEGKIIPKMARSQAMKYVTAGVAKIIEDEHPLEKGLKKAAKKEPAEGTEKEPAEETDPKALVNIEKAAEKPVSKKGNKDDGTNTSGAGKSGSRKNAS